MADVRAIRKLPDSFLLLIYLLYILVITSSLFFSQSHLPFLFPYPSSPTPQRMGVPTIHSPQHSKLHQDRVRPLPLWSSPCIVLVDTKLLIFLPSWKRTERERRMESRVPEFCFSFPRKNLISSMSLSKAEIIGHSVVREVEENVIDP